MKNTLIGYYVYLGIFQNTGEEAGSLLSKGVRRGKRTAVYNA